MPFDRGSSTTLGRITTASWSRTTAAWRILSARRRWPSHGTASSPRSRRASATRRRAVVFLLRRIVLVRSRPSAVIHVIVLFPVSLVVSVPTVTIIITVAVVVLVLIVLLRRRAIVRLLPPWAFRSWRVLLSLRRRRSGSRGTCIRPSLCFISPVERHCVERAQVVAESADEHQKDAGRGMSPGCSRPQDEVLGMLC